MEVLYKAINKDSRKLTEKEQKGNFRLELVSFDDLENMILKNVNDNPRNIYFQKELLNHMTIEEHYKYYEKQGYSKNEIIKKVAKEKDFTHVLLMDDDIRLNPEALVRVFTMLSILKQECKDAFIGGHMLKIDDPHIQSEAADHWDIAGHHPVKFNYNLEKLVFLIV